MTGALIPPSRSLPKGSEITSRLLGLFEGPCRAAPRTRPACRLWEVACLADLSCQNRPMRRGVRRSQSERPKLDALHWKFSVCKSVCPCRSVYRKHMCTSEINKGGGAMFSHVILIYVATADLGNHSIIFVLSWCKHTLGKSNPNHA